jgi:hypothetical protein
MFTVQRIEESLDCLMVGPHRFDRRDGTQPGEFQIDRKKKNASSGNRLPLCSKKNGDAQPT